MIKTITFSILLFIVLAVQAQVPVQRPYPAAPAALANLTTLEAYVGNTDPDFGNGTIFSIAGTDVSLNNVTLNFPALPNGVQSLYVRSRDGGAEWSITNSKKFTVGNFPYPPVPPALPNLTTLEVFVGNSDPGFGDGTILPIAGTDVGVNNATINFPAQANGLQYLYVRSRDAGAEWSLTNYKQFQVGSFNYPTAPTTSPNITKLEYFTGPTDPGFGNGTNLPIPIGNDVSTGNTTITIPALANGNQNLFIRSRDAGAEWSLTNFQQYIVGIPGYSLPPATAPAMANLEYYVDTDPGFGNGTPITFTPSTNVQLTNIPVTISGALSNGNHIFHIRSKQNPWALDNAVTFNVGSVLPITWQFINAELQNGQTLVKWGTEQEINTNKFEVERSINGLRFEKIGEQQAAGNSNTLTKYNYIDVSPVNGFNYYRIKQIDNDGKFSYSTIVKVLNNKNIKEAFIAPNPIANILNLVEPKNIFIQSVTVYDNKGGVVLHKNINREIQVYSLPVDNLPNGNYILKVNYTGATKTIVFIK